MSNISRKYNRIKERQWKIDLGKEIINLATNQKITIKDSFNETLVTLLRATTGRDFRHAFGDDSIDYEKLNAYQLGDLLTIQLGIYRHLPPVD